MSELQRDFGPRFLERVGAENIRLADPPYNQDHYALIRADYVPDGAGVFGPDHHILVDVWDAEGNREFGTPVHFTYPQDPPVTVAVNKTSGPYGADLALFNTGRVVGVWVGDTPATSDYVGGMGLGKIGALDKGDHVTFFLIFQRQRASAGQPDPTPGPGMPSDAIKEIDEAIEKLERAKRRLRSLENWLIGLR